MASEINEFFDGLLGLPSPWFVEKVEFDSLRQSIEIWLNHEKSAISFEGKGWECPECPTPNSLRRDQKAIYDHRAGVWRHLDAFQFPVFIHAKIPRIQCRKHGVVQIQAPWAAKDSRFTGKLREHVQATLGKLGGDRAATARVLKIGWGQVR